MELLKTPLLRVGDGEELDSQPTVLLVKKSLSSIGLGKSRDLEHLGHTERRDVLEPIPLTPRPELQTRTETASSAITRNSELPRLPTPDFASPRLGVLDYLRGGNVENTRFTSTGSISGSVRAGSPSPLRSIPLLSISTISEGASQLKDYLMASTSGPSGPSPPRLYGHARSVPSSSASAIAVSLASSIFSAGRPKLISEIPTTEKFTHS